MSNGKILFFIIIVMITTRSYGLDLGQYSSLCNYSKLPKLEKYKLYKTAFNSLLTKDDKKLLANGLSNYIVFLNDSKKHFDKDCKSDASTPACQSIKRRAKTYYQYDVGVGLELIQSYIAQYSPAIESSLAHCNDADQELAKAFDALKKDIDVTQEIENNQFEDAIFTLSTVARLLDFEVSHKRVKSPLLKRNPFNKDEGQGNITSNLCFDQKKDSTSQTDSVASFVGSLKSKIISFFNPKSPYTLKVE